MEGSAARGFSLIYKDSKWHDPNPATAAGTGPKAFTVPVGLGKY